MPWTVYDQGKGWHFADRASAVAAVRTLSKQGVRNIDVGFMQGNLHHHPDVFADLDEALTPATNIDYAARLLRRLYRRRTAPAVEPQAPLELLEELTYPFDLSKALGCDRSECWWARRFEPQVVLMCLSHPYARLI